MVTVARALWPPLLLLTGCAGTPGRQEPSPQQGGGPYRFTASVPTPGGAVWLEGDFTAAGDTLLLTVNGATCFPETGGTDSFRYRCPGDFGASRSGQTVTAARFSFWRHRPAERPTVAVSFTVRKTSRTCVAYLTDASGARSCSRWSNDVTEVPGTAGAVLKLRRAT